MDYGVYCIKDNCIKEFDTNLIVISKERESALIRDFANMCQEPGTKFNKNPEDFSLWYLGDFDTSEGIVYNINVESCIAKAVDFV